MKEFRVTGLAQENDFENGDEVQYLLVLNKGELRIPISQDSAMAVLKLLHSNGHNDRLEVEPPPDEDQQMNAAENEDFGGGAPPDDDDTTGSRTDGEVLDEDGVGQI